MNERKQGPRWRRDPARQEGEEKQREGCKGRQRGERRRKSYAERHQPGQAWNSGKVQKDLEVFFFSFYFFKLRWPVTFYMGSLFREVGDSDSGWSRPGPCAAPARATALLCRYACPARPSKDGRAWNRTLPEGIEILRVGMGRRPRPRRDCGV